MSQRGAITVPESVPLENFLVSKFNKNLYFLFHETIIINVLTRRKMELENFNTG
jgi:hypothetical protein